MDGRGWDDIGYRYLVTTLDNQALKTTTRFCPSHHSIHLQLPGGRRWQRVRGPRLQRARRPHRRPQRRRLRHVLRRRLHERESQGGGPRRGPGSHPGKRSREWQYLQCVSFYLSIYSFIYLSIYLSLNQSIYLSIFKSIYLRMSIFTTAVRHARRQGLVFLLPVRAPPGQEHRLPGECTLRPHTGLAPLGKVYKQHSSSVKIRLIQIKNHMHRAPPHPDEIGMTKPRDEVLLLILLFL